MSECKGAFTVDVTDVLTSQALQELLARVFRFPEYYGRNWDAFDECISEVARPAAIRIVGISALKARLPRDAGLLLDCLRTASVEADLDVTVV
jgi:RNAse (barnase) inhibitor barstar